MHLTEQQENDKKEQHIQKCMRAMTHREAVEALICAVQMLCEEQRKNAGE